MALPAAYHSRFNGRLWLFAVATLANGPLTPSAWADPQASDSVKGGDHAADDGDDDWIYGQRHPKRRPQRKVWSGYVGLTVVRCLQRSSSSYTDELDAPLGSDPNAVPCSSTADTESAIGPPNTGINLEASVAYAVTRRVSISATLSYEPAPGALAPELAVSYTRPLRAIDWVQELSVTSLYQRGQPAEVVPEVIRLSEGLAWTAKRYEVDAEVYAEPGFGVVTPFITTARTRLAPTLLHTNTAAGGLPQETSVTYGFSIDGERQLTKHWSVGAAAGGSARKGAETLPSPPLFVDLTPFSLTWRSGAWSDSGGLTMSSAHPGGPYNLAAELSMRRDF